jgi:hypothetical protein
MADNPHPKDNPPVLGDEVITYNGGATSADSFGQKPTLQAVGLALRTADGVAIDVNSANPVYTEEGATYGYLAGTAAGTVDVPAAARLKRVSVLANATSATTVTIGGGSTITIPAGGSFDEQIPGLAIGADVVIGGGTPQAYYVSWVT